MAESFFDIDFSQLPVGLAPPRPRITSGSSPTVLDLGTSGAPAMNYSGLGDAINNYRNDLSKGADYFEIDDVDRIDGYYDDIFKNTLGSEAGVFTDLDLLGGEASIGGAQAPSNTINIDYNTYFREVNPPAYLRNFRSPATTETSVAAYSNIGNLQNSSDIASALSNYYGYEITPTAQNLGRFGGDRELYTGSSAGQLAEFHSLVEPILSEQIPFLQTVEGLSYQDALQEAYKRDPMLQALYYKYDVSPIRYGPSGSEYTYDPFSYGEIRTVKSKDLNFVEKLIRAAPTLALSFALGPAAGSVLASTGIAAAGTTANAVLSSALSSAVTAGLQGADLEEALTAAAISGATTYGSEFFSGAGGTEAGTIDPTAPELTFDSIDPTVSVPTSVSDVVDTVTDTLTGADSLSASYDVLDRVIADIGVDSLNAMSNTDLYNYLSSAGDIAGINTLGLTPFQRTLGFMNAARPLRQDLIREGITSTGPAFAPDIFGGTATETLPFEYTPSRIDVTLPDTPIPEVRPTPVRPQPPTQTPGGGGGASGGASSAPATSVVSPSAPSASVTPVVPQPTFSAPGSITGSLFSSFVPALAAAAVTSPSTQPTVAPPVTPIATTAPTTEPTPTTTTEPTDILEDTTAEDTTARLEAEAQAQAEASRLAEEARKAEEARAAAEAKAAAEQEAIAQAEARAEAAEAAREASEAKAKADAAAAEAARVAEAQAQADALAEAVAAGEALGEERFGEGLGTGRGQGAGAGIGAGLGLGLLAGMGGGAGGTGGYTPPDFEDYDFRKTYQAPELLELAPQYAGYQAPTTLQGLFRGFI